MANYKLDFTGEEVNELLHKVNEGIGGASSWNDLTDKPFGESTVTLVDNETIALDEGMALLTCELVEGNTYDLIWNGVEYKGLVANSLTLDGTSIIYIGNAVTFDAENTGETFMIGYAAGQGCMCLDYTGELTEVTITLTTTTANTLDSKYLPEFLQPVVEVTETSKVLVDNATIEGSADGGGHMGVLSETNILIEEGKTYTLIVDGNTYADLVPTVETENDVTRLIMEASSGVPYVLAGLFDPSDSSSGVTLIYFHGDNPNNISYATVTLIVNDSEEKQLIKPESLPEIPLEKLPESHRFYSEDITYYGSAKAENGNLVWDGNTEGIPSVSVNGTTLYLVTNDVGLYDYDTINMKYTYVGTEYTCDNLLSDYMPITDKFKLFQPTHDGVSAFVVLEDNYTYIDLITFPKKGVYVTDNAPWTISADGYEFKEAKVNPLNSKYLPEHLQFGETTTVGDTVTFDGNLTGKEKLSISSEDGVNTYLVKVSDAVPTMEDLQNGVSITISTPEGTTTMPVPSDVIVDAETLIVESNDMLFAIAKEDNVDFMGLGTLPSKGVYVMSAELEGISFGIVELTINGYNGFVATEIKYLDNKFLEPFETVKVSTDTLTWDGNITGLYATGGYYLVSDVVPTYDDLLNGCIELTNYEGRQTLDLSESLLFDDTDNGYISVASFFAVVITQPNASIIALNGLTFEKTGVYFRKSNAENNSETYLAQTHSLTLNGYTGLIEEQTKLKPECLPVGISISFVDFQTTDMNNFTASKSHSEILAEWQSGSVIFGRVMFGTTPLALMPVCGATHDYITFKFDNYTVNNGVITASQDAYLVIDNNDVLTFTTLE